MTPEQFCYWLRGFFEIAALEKRADSSLNHQQGEAIAKHLKLVFNPVTVQMPDSRPAARETSPIDQLGEFLKQRERNIHPGPSDFPRPPEIYCSDNNMRVDC